MDVLTAVRQWLRHDPDEADRQELRDLAIAALDDDAASADLTRRMSGTLQFGTAGLRGAIGAGPNRMNTATVTTATAGFVKVLQETVGPDCKVVIGYDARHRSEEFARTVAGVVTAAGGRALVIAQPSPTPLLAFAVRHLAADAGIMITASHNPASDNGYKVYVGGRMVPPSLAGLQIVSPMDDRIANEIAAVGPANEVPVATEGWEQADPSLIDDYLATIEQRREELSQRIGHEFNLSNLTVVLTPMHGVGGELAKRALKAAGVGSVIEVTSQWKPDPDFPTVQFPNPEEAGALDEAFELAAQHDADLIIALDPDADRCAVGINDVGWRRLSGGELGALLGEFICGAYADEHWATVSRSVPTSSELDVIAKEHGLRCVETLGGFKWIARVNGLVYGFEEAIGYCVNPDQVRDKDGISTAVVICLMASLLQDNGLDLVAVQNELAARHGAYVTRPLTIRMNNPDDVTTVLAKLESNPPRQFGASPVIDAVDMSQGYKGLEPWVGFRYATERADRVIARPSGTEPKLKCYIEVIEPVASAGDVARARDAAARRADLIADELAMRLGVDDHI